MTAMTKAERSELAQLVRRREKLAKADVDRVAAERLADFERQAASEYRVDDDEVWAEQVRIAERAIADAELVIAERCRALGVADWTAPGLYLSWHGRGENAVRARVVELRRVAQTSVAAAAKAAKVAVERASVEVQTRLVAGGLESDEARAFLASMPTAEALMPAVTVAEIEAGSGMAGLRVVEDES